MSLLWAAALFSALITIFNATKSILIMINLLSLMKCQTFQNVQSALHGIHKFNIFRSQFSTSHQNLIYPNRKFIFFLIFFIYFAQNRNEIKYFNGRGRKNDVKTALEFIINEWKSEWKEYNISLIKHATASYDSIKRCASAYVWSHSDEIFARFHVFPLRSVSHKQQKNTS